MLSTRLGAGLPRLLAQSETGKAPSLRTDFLRALSVVVLRERGGKSWLSGADRLDGNRSGLLRIAGWGFDAMTGKGGGYEFDQIFHRGLLMARRKLAGRGAASAARF